MAQKNIPETYFAAPERIAKKDLRREIEIAAGSPVMTGILKSVGGLLAVLDEHRQIVAINDAFASMLGIDDVEAALGLRLGEVVQCIYSNRQPSGCGTSEYCSTCGAAIATVSALETNSTAERTCAVVVKDGDTTKDLFLEVRCQPIEVEGTRFLLVFLIDITKQQQKAALERVFFHDINNMLTALVGASEMMAQVDHRSLAQTIHKVSQHLLKEVSIQRCLAFDELDSYQPSWENVRVSDVMKDLKDFFSHHAVSYRKVISFPGRYPDLVLKTDLSILLRILSNMLINGLEATGEESEVRINLTAQENALCFHVWNRQSISDDIARRVFQRNFSTKAQEGRGIGTYSMKLFGEKILHGKVYFETSPDKGTIFTLEHPLS